MHSCHALCVALVPPGRWLCAWSATCPAGCTLRSQCIRKPETTQRKIAVHHRIPDDPSEPIHRMRAAIDSPRGRQLYSQRIATVEPVFANLRHNKRLNRFTLRGRDKVGTQWRLFCLAHNIEKLAHCGL